MNLTVCESGAFAPAGLAMRARLRAIGGVLFDHGPDNIVRAEMFPPPGAVSESDLIPEAHIGTGHRHGRDAAHPHMGPCPRP